MMNLLSHYFISTLEKKCNQLICPECGKHHLVKLAYSGSVVSTPSFDDEACDGFKEKVNAFVKTEIKRHINNPLPFIR